VSGRKKVAFGVKPRPAPVVTPDDWAAATPPAGPMKRLTIDVSAALHTRIRVACARRGTRMADEIRALLEQAYPADGEG
jgi:mRNA-degrading endonuclease toxin of MazEF toxin-antitoxin module